MLSGENYFRAAICVLGAEASKPEFAVKASESRTWSPDIRQGNSGGTYFRFNGEEPGSPSQADSREAHAGLVQVAKERDAIRFARAFDQ